MVLFYGKHEINLKLGTQKTRSELMISSVFNYLIHFVINY
jgi:hypothetical protein